MYSFFLVCLLSHSLILVRFIHVATCTNVSFLFIAEYYLFIPRFIRLPVDGRLGYFQFRAITNKATINIHVQIFV